MTPKRAQVLLRLPKPLKVAAEAAATELGLSLTDWVIAAINAQLGEVDSPTDSSELSAKLSDIDSRLSAIDSRLIALESKPTQPAPKPRGGLTEEERDAIAAADRPTDRPTAAAQPAADHPKANGGRWLTTTQAVRVAEPRGGPPNGNTLKRLARKGKVEELGLRYCPHGSKDKTLATFEDLMFPRMSDRLDLET